MSETSPKSKYRLYVDEVGNPDLGNSDNPNHRFLSLTGVILNLDYVQTTLHSDMESLKTKYFSAHPDEPIIFHRKELLNGKPPFTALQDAMTRTAFDEDLLIYLNKWQYTVITVCLDKQKHRDTYTTWRYDPYHYCLAILLERFNFWLKRQPATGDVMAESRGGKEDIRLKESFNRLWKQGTEFVNQEQFQKSFTSSQLKVKPKSANISGLQLADLVAHPSRAEILDEEGLLGRPLASFSRKVIQVLQKKYDCQAGRMFGKKFI
ncbi:MAG: DUF3800 domain-containing protein [Thermodesulfobacteriota bacterium]|nr:DUF3800 domain-containing protein [Thermodesulfobacteriota bacterium]